LKLTCSRLPSLSLTRTSFVSHNASCGQQVSCNLPPQDASCASPLLSRHSDGQGDPQPHPTRDPGRPQAARRQIRRRAGRPHRPPPGRRCRAGARAPHGLGSRCSARAVEARRGRRAPARWGRSRRMRSIRRCGRRRSRRCTALSRSRCWRRARSSGSAHRRGWSRRGSTTSSWDRPMGSRCSPPPPQALPGAHVRRDRPPTSGVVRPPRPASLLWPRRHAATGLGAKNRVSTGVRRPIRSGRRTAASPHIEGMKSLSSLARVHRRPAPLSHRRDATRSRAG